MDLDLNRFFWESLSVSTLMRLKLISWLMPKEFGMYRFVPLKAFKENRNLIVAKEGLLILSFGTFENSGEAISKFYKSVKSLL